MTQYTKVLLLGGAAIFMNLLICAIVLAYIRISLRQRCALGFFWRFDRDRQPIWFWFQLALVSTLIAYQVYQMTFVILTLAHVSQFASS